MTTIGARARRVVDGRDPERALDLAVIGHLRVAGGIRVILLHARQVEGIAERSRTGEYDPAVATCSSWRNSRLVGLVRVDHALARVEIGQRDRRWSSRRAVHGPEPSGIFEVVRWTDVAVFRPIVGAARVSGSRRLIDDAA